MQTNIRIESPDRSEKMSRFTDVMKECWGMPDAEAIPSHLFEAARSTGNLLGAYSDDRVVGLAIQLPDLKRDNVIYFHAIGVVPEYSGNGIGEQLMREQRKRALNHGYERIEWTYDPLLGGNAKLYISKMGATISEYREDVYEEENDSTAGETPTDRFVATWDIKDDRVERFLNGESREYDSEAILVSEGADIDFSNSKIIERDDEFELESIDTETVAVEIPSDRSELDTEEEEQWRLATRHTFQELFSREYRVVDFFTGIEGNKYILSS